MSRRAPASPARPDAPSGAPAGRAAGIAAALATVCIWASFMVVTRYAVTGSFTVPELVFLRLVPAAVLLAPVMWRLGVVPWGLSWPRALILMIGAGAGFPAIIMTGLWYAPASDAGALAPGMLPFWTALAAAAMLGEYPGPRRMVGLGLVLAGAAIVSLWAIAFESAPGAWRGHLLFLLGSGLWGVYTVVFRQSGLTPLHALAIGMFWPLIVFVPVLIWIGVPFAGAGLGEIVLMGFLQSVMMAIVALLLYGFAVRRLGAAETGALGALTPILALIGGGVFLGEPVGALKVAGVLLVAVGVFMASGVLTRLAPRRD